MIRRDAGLPGRFGIGESQPPLLPSRRYRQSCPPEESAPSPAKSSSAAEGVNPQRPPRLRGFVHPVKPLERRRLALAGDASVIDGLDFHRTQDAVVHGDFVDIAVEGAGLVVYFR